MPDLPTLPDLSGSTVRAFLREESRFRGRVQHLLHAFYLHLEPQGWLRFSVNCVGLRWKWVPSPAHPPIFGEPEWEFAAFPLNGFPVAGRTIASVEYLEELGDRWSDNPYAVRQEAALTLGSRTARPFASNTTPATPCTSSGGRPVRPLLLAASLLLAGAVAAAAGANENPDRKPLTRLRAEQVPEPPQQHTPWQAPEEPVPATFVQATEALFRIGLPDPRGCEYRRVLIEDDDYLNLSGPLLQWRAGFLLPGRTAGLRFAIGWDGVLYPVLEVGPRLDLDPEVEQLLAADRASREFDEPGRRWTRLTLVTAALLLRLGRERPVQAIWWDQGSTMRPPYEFVSPAKEWLDALRKRAVQSHMWGEDGLALFRLRQLHHAAALAEGEAARRWEADTRNRGRTRDPEPFFPIPDEERALLADLERRARETGDPSRWEREAEAEPRADRRIQRLIRALDQVDVQPLALENPGFPDLAQDPIVLALAAEGGPAVEPLIDCLGTDSRLTRSLDWWKPRSFWPRFTPAWQAATAALSLILGPKATQAVSESITQATRDLPLEQFRPVEARILSAYCRRPDALVSGEGLDRRVTLDLASARVGTVLRRLFEGSGLEYRVSPALARTRISLRVRDLRLETALRLFEQRLRQRFPRLEVIRLGGLWVYTVAPKAPRPPSGAP